MCVSSLPEPQSAANLCCRLKHAAFWILTDFCHIIEELLHEALYLVVARFHTSEVNKGRLSK
jgi:hypothetical protein